ncbi:LysR family transcriptional regulator, partial [Streptomyces sp. NPDC003832]
MRSFDLNLARIFVLLYETGSATVTAETLHLTQPTVSYSLAKLRRHFDDELFRRTGRGLTPTVVAQRLYEPLQRALAEIDEAVGRTDDFDPVTMPGRFTLALSDLGEATLLPPVGGIRISTPCSTARRWWSSTSSTTTYTPTGP